VRLAEASLASIQWLTTESERPQPNRSLVHINRLDGLKTCRSSCTMRYDASEGPASTTERLLTTLKCDSMMGSGARNFCGGYGSAGSLRKGYARDTDACEFNSRRFAGRRSDGRRPPVGRGPPVIVSPRRGGFASLPPSLADRVYVRPERPRGKA
jgi:hypothetical protein